MASPRVLDPRVQRPLTRTGERPTRSPSYPFSVLGRPWEIVPAHVIPVLPGETMTSAFLQGQFWTDPLRPGMKNNPWTWEYWCFYAKFRDLPGWEEGVDGIGADLIDMIETGEALTPHIAPTRLSNTYCAKGGIDYAWEAMKRIIECYFREEGQVWNVATGPTPEFYPLAHAFAGARRDVHERLAVGGVGTNPTPEDRRVAMPGYVGGLVYQAWQDYAANRNQTTAELQSMDYEDIIRASGGKVVARHEDREDMHIPELLGMIRHFDYPVNTVEPTTGSPSVAFGHRVKQGLKQNFRFPEFGWVIGLMCWRPKAFLKNQVAGYYSMMKSRTDWFMPNEDPNLDTHILNIIDAEGPLSAIFDTPGNNYAIDLRNLLWHGEQFLNWDPSVGGTGGDALVTLPTVGGGRDYPSTADLDAVWATTGGRIRMNGVMDVAIKSYDALNPNIGQDDRGLANRD